MVVGVEGWVPLRKRSEAKRSEAKHPAPSSTNMLRLHVRLQSGLVDSLHRKGEIKHTLHATELIDKTIERMISLKLSLPHASLPVPLLLPCLPSLLLTRDIFKHAHKMSVQPGGLTQSER